jgi:NADH pyrophosphatase NudC (nudix superfamily)
MKREISDIGWFSIENALQKIRRTNIEKRELLLRIERMLNTFHIVQ